MDRRLFIGIPVPYDLYSFFTGLQNRFDGNGRVFRWIPPKLLKVTITFLGQTDDSELLNISERVALASRWTGRFPFYLRSFELFPSGARPNVLAVVVDGGKPLIDYVHRLHGALAQWQRTEKARKFSPHITVARIRSSNAVDRHHISSQMGTFMISGSWQAECAVLFESHLRPSGPEYIRHRSCPFGLKA